MKRVGVMVNGRKAHAAEAVRRVAAEAAAVGLELVADSRAAAVAGAGLGCNAWW